MRLRMRIERNELPAVQVLWAIEPTESKNTIAQLLEHVNERFPLEGNTWGLDDYAVTVAGYEATHFSELGNTFKDEDEVVIKPLSFAELRTRTMTGRDQISEDGRHLLDGIPFGRPMLKRPRRPEVRIPPRKRQRVEDEQALLGVEEGLLSDDEQEDEEDYEEDYEEEDGEEDEEDRKEDRDAEEDATQELDKSPKSGHETDQSSDSSHDDSDSSEASDSDSDSESGNESESDSDDSSEGSWDGVGERGDPPSSEAVITTQKPSMARVSLAPSNDSLRNTPVKRANAASTSSPAISTPPGRGNKSTQNRNARRRDAHRLKYLKINGTLPATATLRDMYEWQEGKTKTTEPPTRDCETMETERQKLIGQIAKGGIDVDEPPAIHRRSEADDEPPDEEPIRRPEPPLIESSIPVTKAQGERATEPRENPNVDHEADVEASNRRNRVDVKGINRLVFGSLGVRNPKTQADRDALQKKLAARPKNPTTAQAALQQNEQGAEDDKDPEAWREKVILTAVECLDEGVELSAPDFPFQQRWDPQYQLTKKRAAGGIKSKRGRKRQLLAQTNESHSDYVETYDKYNQNGGGDALDYDEPEDDEDFDDSYWEEGALLEDGDDAEETSNTFPPLPENSTLLPPLPEDNAENGDFVVFEELTVSPATSWAPQIVAKVAKLQGKTDEGWSIVEAPDHPKEYDENGKRVYRKFEMESISDDEEEERPRVVQWAELQGVRLLKRGDN